jgi:flavin-binding protein dodecin
MGQILRYTARQLVSNHLTTDNADMPRADVQSIVTYGGPWTDYCRQPLIWLGHPDPATSLIEQIREDPDGEVLGGLMAAWYAAFGSSPTTVRRAVEAALRDNGELLDAIRECPVEERGEINRSKVGWWLRKNANRIVGGFELQQAKADGRTAWRVIKMIAPPLPALPPFGGRLGENGAPYSGRV